MEKCELNCFSCNLQDTYENKSLCSTMQMPALFKLMFDELAEVKELLKSTKKTKEVKEIKEVKFNDN